MSFFFGGMLAMKYLVVKASVGRKILVFADTPNGRKVFVGKFGNDEKRDSIVWKYNGDEQTSEYSKRNISRYYGVSYVACNAEDPSKLYDLTLLGEKRSDRLDMPVHNNMLKRVITRPQEQDLQRKILIVGLILLGLVVVGVGLTYFRVIAVEQAVNTLGVVA